VRTGHSEEILDMTLKEEVQLGLTRAMRHPEIESLRLYDDELVLVVDPGHRFTGRGSAGLAEIGEEQLIFFDHDSSYFEQTHALFRNAGIGELRTMEVDNIEAAKRMVEHRLGVAFLPRTAIVRSVAAGNLVLIPVSENPEMTRTIVALKRRDTPASGPVAAFLEVASTLGEPQDRAELSPTLATEFENLQLIDLFT
jgi:DNA-binding transcriptional LysR family regulator